LVATQDESKNIAERFDLLSIDNLKASIKIKPMTDQVTYKVSGSYEANIVQSCIVSGDSIKSHLSETFEGWYRDQSKIVSFVDNKLKINEAVDDNEYEVRSEEEDPEIIEDGILGLGEVILQFLGLSIDVYPKAYDDENGDHIEMRPEDKPNPFAKLAELKTKE
jgi:hypothetical protein